MVCSFPALLVATNRVFSAHSLSSKFYLTWARPGLTCLLCCIIIRYCREADRISSARLILVLSAVWLAVVCLLVTLMGRSRSTRRALVARELRARLPQSASCSRAGGGVRGGRPRARRCCGRRRPGRRCTPSVAARGRSRTSTSCAGNVSEPWRRSDCGSWRRQRGAADDRATTRQSRLHTMRHCASRCPESLLHLMQMHSRCTDPHLH